MRTLAGWLLIALLLAACSSADEPAPSPAREAGGRPSGGGASSAGGPGSSVAATPAPLATAAPLGDFRPPMPVTARISADTERAEAGFIGREGGALEATGSDGSHYRLVIPPGSLARRELITLTPLLDAAGGPIRDGARPYGLRIEPGSVRLFAGATLAISSAASIEPVLPFVADSGGANLHFGLLDASADAIVLQLLGFSDHFVLPASDVDPDATGDPGATTPEDLLGQLENEVGDMVAGERARYLLEGEGEGDGTLSTSAQERIVELLDEYYERFIDPNFESWSINCTAARRDAGMALGWARTFQLFAGIEDDPREALIREHVLAGAERCVEELIEPCLHPMAVPAALEAWKTANMLGSAKYADENPDFGPIMCGDLYGRITQTTRLHRVTTDSSGAQVTEILDEFIEAWVSISIDERGYVTDDTIFEVTGDFHREDRGECTYTETERWYGLVPKEEPALLTLGIFSGGPPPFLTPQVFLPSTKVTVAPRGEECRLDRYSSESTRFPAIGDNPVGDMYFSSEPLYGEVSADRMTINFSRTREVEGGTEVIQGTVQSKTPLP